MIEAEAIAAAGLRKSYGRTMALDGLDLSVVTGEVHGFLGPNGSGKTTTIRILLGLLRADGGTAALLGGDPWRDATALHHRLAYVPGDVTLWPNLSGGEVIDLLGRLRGRMDDKRRASLVERFDLDPKKKARAYSKGNRQKVALISALASDVELLILDEPTSGLDPLMEAAFRDCVEEERHRGRTVLLSSHILSEVEALCDRVTIIRNGRTVETGTLAGLRHLTRTSIAADLARRPAGLEQLPGVHDLDVQDLSGPDLSGPDLSGPDLSGPDLSGPDLSGPDGGGRGARVRCEVDTARLNEFLRHLTDAGILSLVSQPPTLEELFLRHYAAQRPGEAAPAPGAPGRAGSAEGVRP